MVTLSIIILLAAICNTMIKENSLFCFHGSSSYVKELQCYSQWTFCLLLVLRMLENTTSRHVVRIRIVFQHCGCLQDFGLLLQCSWHPCSSGVLYCVCWWFIRYPTAYQNSASILKGAKIKTCFFLSRSVSHIGSPLCVFLWCSYLAWGFITRISKLLFSCVYPEGQTSCRLSPRISIVLSVQLENQFWHETAVTGLDPTNIITFLSTV